VYECCAIPVLVNPLKVNNEFAGIVFGVREDFGSEESNDVVRDDFARFVLEISVVDAEVGVEPVDFVGDELSWNKAL
jgi:hypothetical protein